MPSAPADLATLKPTAAKKIDGVKAARAAQIATTFPQWRFLDRDFISDMTSSFAVLENERTQQCLFVTEVGADPVSLTHTEFSPASKCSGILASSRYDKAGTTYYLAMFKSSNGHQPLAVVSVRADGNISAEAALAAAINRAGAINNIRDAKAFLSKALP